MESVTSENPQPSCVPSGPNTKNRPFSGAQARPLLFEISRTIGLPMWKRTVSLRPSIDEIFSGNTTCVADVAPQPKRVGKKMARTRATGADREVRGISAATVLSVDYSLDGLYLLRHVRSRRFERITASSTICGVPMFISFEGIDCSGKTTQARALAESLRSDGHDVLELREPGDTPISEHIREILLNHEYSGINDRTELLLFAASRAQLVAEAILPALREGKIVICDRFSDSTIAYQGFGRGLPLEDIVHINRIATQETVPDLTFYLDISPETSVQRRATRNGEASDRIEESGIHFFERVIEGYMRMADLHADRYCVVDGGEPPEMLTGIIARLVREQLSHRSQLSSVGPAAVIM